MKGQNKIMQSEVSHKIQMGKPVGEILILAEEMSIELTVTFFSLYQSVRI
jgi:hypothetical protein